MKKPSHSIIVEFHDSLGQQCNIQQASTNGQDALWIGVITTGPDMLKFGIKAEMNCRMLLTQEQARKLLPILARFVINGNVTSERKPKRRSLEEDFR